MIHSLKAVIRNTVQRFKTYNFYKTFRIKTTLSKSSKMESWEDEKARYLNMDIDEKRRQYSCGNNYLKVSDINTWAEYVSRETRMATKIPMLPENTIDVAKNVALASKISILRGNITTLEVDAVVNAANTSLLGGGGVDGAIHNAAGDCLLMENRTLAGCATGQVKLSGGYKLPAKYVISTVGPQGERTNDLKNCYRNSLQLMLEKGLRTIAFPCISTGIYGYPLVPAAHVAAMEVRKILESNGDQIDRVIFCLFAPADEAVYQGILQTYFPILID